MLMATLQLNIVDEISYAYYVYATLASGNNVGAKVMYLLVYPLL